MRVLLERSGKPNKWKIEMLRRSLITLAVIAMGSLCSCRTTPIRPHASDDHGRIYYLDGAGGPSLLGDLGRRVHRGLVWAGYKGSFYSYPWYTGLGLAVDQGMSVGYKRRKAKKLAQTIRQYTDAHPRQPVNLIGLSAGTAIVLFTLEALPESCSVDNVVLLGSSLSSHYDVSDALRHVRDRMYVVTSEKDTVLRFLIPLAGTADRKYCGTCAVGLHGFHFPSDADTTDERLALYHKLENIEWTPEFERVGNRGGHIGSIQPRFIRDYVAPLILDNGPRYTRPGVVPAEVDTSTSTLSLGS